MRLDCRIANDLWALSSRRSEGLFRSACHGLADAQSSLLMGLLKRNRATLIGNRFGFSRISSVNAFRSAFPVTTHEFYKPFLEEASVGARSVLTADPIERFHLTSGTVTANKSIPFTRGLRDDFGRALGPWIRDLHRRFPGVRNGTSYWVISPPNVARPGERDGTPPSVIPTSFDDDATYLSRAARIAQRILWSVPTSLARVADEERFRYLTVLSLIADRDLSLMSLWSPSFLTSLLRWAAPHLPLMVDELERGGARGRARELATLLSPPTVAWDRLWPRLAVISCWADGWAQASAAELAGMFPTVHLQPKGVLATEGVVSVPYGSSEVSPVLAACSHFFEFQKVADRVMVLAHELEAGEEYEVVLTTSGGLYRYLLGDIVRCEGFFGDAPRLRYLGRSGVTSDLCGEKLHEAFVHRALANVFGRSRSTPSLAVLTPDIDARPFRYRLLLMSEGPPPAGRTSSSVALRAAVEDELLANMHYRTARHIGQLSPVEVVLLDERQAEEYLRTRGTRSRTSTRKMLALDPEPYRIQQPRGER